MDRSFVQVDIAINKVDWLIRRTKMELEKGVLTEGFDIDL